MGGSVAPFAWSTVWTDNGVPAVGYKLFTYLAGTSTKTPTYQDAAMAVPHSNPILLNAAGQIPVGFFVNGGLSYKFVLATALDADPPLSPIWTRDGIPGGGGSLQPWLRNAATGVTTLANIGDKVGIGTAAPTKPFSVAEKFTVDANGRVLGNNTPAYDLSSNLRSADVWLDAAGQAGIDTTGYGGEFELPAPGKFRELIRLTGTLGNDDLSSTDSEFSGLRFELKNNGPNLYSQVRGVIGSITLTAGGHARAGYFRTVANVGATGYMTSILASVTAAAAQAAGNAIGVFVQSDGIAARAIGIQISNNVGTGYQHGIVFDDAFEASLSAIRLRQATINGRIVWNSSPYIESTTADQLVITAATAANIKVGIGTATPQKQLHVVGTNGAVASFPTPNATEVLIVENNSNAGVMAVVGATSNFNLKVFGSGDGATEDGQLSYGRSARQWTIKTAGTNRFTFDASGNFLLNGGGYTEFIEISAPAAGAANSARLYAEDTGGGKTRLVVRFATGAVQTIATEP